MLEPLILVGGSGVLLGEVVVCSVYSRYLFMRSEQGTGLDLRRFIYATIGGMDGSLHNDVFIILRTPALQWTLNYRNKITTCRSRIGVVNRKRSKIPRSGL